MSRFCIVETVSFQVTLSLSYVIVAQKSSTGDQKSILFWKEKTYFTHIDKMLDSLNYCLLCLLYTSWGEEGWLAWLAIPYTLYENKQIEREIIQWRLLKPYYSFFSLLFFLQFRSLRHFFSPGFIFIFSSGFGYPTCNKCHPPASSTVLPINRILRILNIKEKFKSSIKRLTL